MPRGVGESEHSKAQECGIQPPTVSADKPGLSKAHKNMFFSTTLRLL